MILRSRSPGLSKSFILLRSREWKKSQYVEDLIDLVDVLDTVTQHSVIEPVPQCTGVIGKTGQVLAPKQAQQIPKKEPHK